MDVVNVNLFMYKQLCKAVTHRSRFWNKLLWVELLRTKESILNQEISAPLAIEKLDTLVIMLKRKSSHFEKNVTPFFLISLYQKKKTSHVINEKVTGHERERAKDLNTFFKTLLLTLTLLSNYDPLTTKIRDTVLEVIVKYKNHNLFSSFNYIARYRKLRILQNNLN